MAAARPVELTRHGDVRVDPYYWLRDREDPEVIAYLEAENAYTERVLAPTSTLQDRIFDEIRGRVQETDVSPPARKGPWEYFTRTFEGSQYASHGRRPTGTPEGVDETVLLDENELAAGLEYFSLGGLALSPDQVRLAYSFDDDGGELHSLRFRDLASRADLPDVIDGVYYGLAWANDNATVFYVRPDDAMRPYQVWRHTVGTDLDDVLVFEEPDERFFVSVGRARSGRAIILSSDSKLTSESRLLDPDDPAALPRVVEPRTDDVEYDVEHHVDADGAEQLYILTNADGATNFKLVRAPVTTPGRAAWSDVVAHRDDVKLDGVDVFRDFLVLSERTNGLEQLRVIGLTDPALDRVLTMDDPAYSTWIADNLEFDTPSFRFGYTSLVFPTSAFDETVASGDRTLVKRTPVLGGFDPTDYTSARLWATAPDGAQIPLSVVHRRDTPVDGSAPALLYGYGSYESSVDPTFSIIRLSLLDRGFVFAIAHIRGGGELGRPWYEHGKLREKRNTFTDFVACAGASLCRRLHGSGPARRARRQCRWPAHGRGRQPPSGPVPGRGGRGPVRRRRHHHAGHGAPAHGHGMGGVGQPARRPRRLRLHEVVLPLRQRRSRSAYPAMLVTAGLNDPRVSYWEPAKWVAKLRATRTDDRTLVLKTEMGAGHGGPSGRYDAWRDEAMTLAFLVTELTGGSPS